MEQFAGTGRVSWVMFTLSLWGEWEFSIPFVDVGLVHLPLMLISIYFPIFLFAATINNIDKINPFQIRCLLIYLIGLSLAGCLLPTSIVIRFLPIAWFNKLSGNLIGDYEGYIWYQIPLLGLIIIGFVSYYYSRYLLIKMKIN